MYLLKEARGRGVGRTLLDTCLRTAKEIGFATCYLETLKGMDSAQASAAMSCSNQPRT